MNRALRFNSAVVADKGVHGHNKLGVSLHGNYFRHFTLIYYKHLIAICTLIPRVPAMASVG